MGRQSRTGAIAGADEAVFWITGAKGGQMLRSLRVTGSGVEVIALGNEVSGVEGLAVTAEGLYFVAGPVGDGDTGHCGSVWRLERPS